MGALKEWIINICAAVFFITAIEMILPNNSMKKYAKFVLGLILMIVVINPIFKLLDKSGQNITLNILENEKTFAAMENNLQEREKYKKDNIEKTLGTFERNLAKSCEVILKEKYPESEFQVKVKGEYKNNNFSVSNVTVGVEDNGVKVIKKIDIKANSNLNEDSETKEVRDEKNIKNYISSQLNIDEGKIKIYNLKR